MIVSFYRRINKMKKYLRVLSIVLALALAICGLCACTATKEGDNKLIMATNAAFPPYEFVDENNEFSQEAWAANHPLAYKDSYIEANSPVNFYVVHGSQDTTVIPAAVDNFVNKLGEFAPTRKFGGHGDKKKK